MKNKELLENFVDWLRDRNEGVYFAFDETDKAIDEFLKEIR